MKINSISANSQTQIMQNKQNKNKPAFGTVIYSDLAKACPNLTHQIQLGVVVGNIAKQIEKANKHKSIASPEAVPSLGQAIHSFNTILKFFGLNGWQVNLKNSKLIMEKPKGTKIPSALIVKNEKHKLLIPSDNRMGFNTPQSSLEFNASMIFTEQGENLYSKIKKGVTGSDSIASKAFNGLENQVPSEIIKEAPLFITNGEFKVIAIPGTNAGEKSRSLGNDTHGNFFAALAMQTQNIEEAGRGLVHYLKDLTKPNPKKPSLNIYKEVKPDSVMGKTVEADINNALGL